MSASGRLDGASQVGDVVLRRADGFITYHLATAVDELSLGITTVVRGEDLWRSTAAQVAVMRELGAPPPTYAHVPLWREEGTGQRLSKRSGAEGLEGLRARGLDAGRGGGAAGGQRRAGAAGIAAERHRTAAAPGAPWCAPRRKPPA